MLPRACGLREHPLGRIGGPLIDRQLLRRFELPRSLGEAISGWDDPDMVAAGDARHMRADDYVVGVTFADQHRAYPLWVIDNYHVINDRVGGKRLMVTSCERCQSGAAFALPPDVEARRGLFRAVGFANATLLMKDMPTGS